MTMAVVRLKKKDVKKATAGLRQALARTAKETATFKFRDLGKKKKAGLRQPVKK